ncbi:hypothetical protein MuYL_2946 [Mucilaginibacter xinganensis]|uniref:Uncharacterized protein n=1 Tax=Mucilaginibacter xinganensis TaxID=1234841 RepID=A0A223NYA2_9SPHI|nr:hypothetical protein MuYL_2946 [Mucilaginibacter xinganensis]
MFGSYLGGFYNYAEAKVVFSKLYYGNDNGRIYFAAKNSVI